MTIASAAFMLFLIIDPVGNVPAFLSVLQPIEKAQRRRVIMRELLFALITLVIFLFSGKYLLDFLHISPSSLGIAGGIILFLISLKMIFGSQDGIFPQQKDVDPYIVPLAIPLLAGPSAMAMLMLMMAQEPERWMDWLLAVFIAWAAAGAILIGAEPVAQKLGPRFIEALQRLMGLLLTTIAIEMLLTGIGQVFAI